MPNLIVDKLNEVTRFKCPDCGRWEYAGKGRIRHSSRCSCNTLQPVSEGQEQRKPHSLEAFARQVRATGMAHGRQDLLVECVRTGLLSASEAMNLDD